MRHATHEQTRPKFAGRNARPVNASHRADAVDLASQEDVDGHPVTPPDIHLDDDRAVGIVRIVIVETDLDPAGFVAIVFIALARLAFAEPA